MNVKISPALAEHLAQSPATAEVPVLVTSAAGADPARLTAAGLAIRQSFSAIPVVAGTIRPDRVEELARLAEVESIDFDGEVRALDAGRGVE